MQPSPGSGLTINFRKKQHIILCREDTYINSNLLRTPEFRFRKIRVVFKCGYFCCKSDKTSCVSSSEHSSTTITSYFGYSWVRNASRFCFNSSALFEQVIITETPSSGSTVAGLFLVVSTVLRKMIIIKWAKKGGSTTGITNHYSLILPKNQQNYSFQIKKS